MNDVRPSPYSSANPLTMNTRGKLHVCKYIKRSEDVLDVYWTSYVRSMYVLCPGAIWQSESKDRNLNISNMKSRAKSSLFEVLETRI